MVTTHMVEVADNALCDTAPPRVYTTGLPTKSTDQSNLVSNYNDPSSNDDESKMVPNLEPLDDDSNKLLSTLSPSHPKPAESMSLTGTTILPTWTMADMIPRGCEKQTRN